MARAYMPTPAWASLYECVDRTRYHGLCTSISPIPLNLFQPYRAFLRSVVVAMVRELNISPHGVTEYCAAICLRYSCTVVSVSHKGLVRVENRLEPGPLETATRRYLRQNLASIGLVDGTSSSFAPDRPSYNHSKHTLDDRHVGI